MPNATSTVFARALRGIDAPGIIVETHIRGGLPGFSIVGLPETAVREARDRVKSAILNSGFTFPRVRVTVNLAPADIPKEGGRFDLGIAIGILCASKQLPSNKLTQLEILGELGLTGNVRPVRGALSAAIDANLCGRALMVPQQNLEEASLLRTNTVYGVNNLLDACQILRGKGAPATSKKPPDTPSRCETNPVKSDRTGYLLDDVKGQFAAKRALLVAAAGAHHILMTGPPGCGKTMLALRLKNLLPAPDEEELAAIIKIHSAAGYSDLSCLFKNRPFRSPHHSASTASITGGGRPVMPGETSLAHRGVLFLDELPEFNRQVLESLREPMESREVMITRANTRVKYPAAFQLVAAMNPCPVGRSCNENSCLCSAEQKRRYRSKISAPILDRIDIHVQVESLSEEDLFAKQPHIDENALRACVVSAREIQKNRNAGELNSDLSTQALNIHCELDATSRKLLKQAISKFGLSARACHRLLKVSRTIADLEQADRIEAHHMSEALAYRRPVIGI